MDDVRKTAYMLDHDEPILIDGIELRAPVGRFVADGVEISTIAKRNGRSLVNVYALPQSIDIERMTNPRQMIIRRREKTIDPATQRAVGFEVLSEQPEMAVA